MTFTLPCIPPKTSHHAKRIVRIGRFTRLADAPALQDAKATLDSLLLPHQPAQPVTGPVTLALTYVWPWLASDGKAVRAGGRVPHPKRPDCDNLAKTFTDRLVALRFLQDDGQVVTLTVQKYRGDEPGITVTLQAVSAEEAA
jgi:Holliday junction resolvase RusA-like endonuclease